MDEGTESIASGAAGTEGPPPEGPSVPAVARPGPGPRQTPTMASMVAVGGGLLATAGLIALLDAIDVGDRQGIAALVSLLFTALGVALMVINRSRRAAAGGVALAALSALPLAVFLFFDSDTYGKAGDPSRAVGAFSGVAVRTSLILLTAAGLWLLGYLLGPGRRYGFFLGAALVALWLVPVNHIVVDSARGLSPVAFFPRYDTGIECNGSITYPEDGSGSFTTEVGPIDGTDSLDCGPVRPSRRVHQPSDPTVPLGLVSLAFAAAYLGVAGIRDRRGDAATATPFLVGGLVTIVVGFVTLVGHMGPLPGALYLLALASIVLLVGVGGSRRFSSWFGVFGGVAALVWLVSDTFDSSTAFTGAVLTALGIAVALGVGVLEQRNAAASPPVPVPPAAPGEGHPVWGTAPAGDGEQSEPPSP